MRFQGIQATWEASGTIADAGTRPIDKLYDSQGALSYPDSTP